MLIKQMFRQEKMEQLSRAKTKITFFLVDRVPLVFQQASVIEANGDGVNVKYLCGQMNVDNWSEKQWHGIFEEVDVCVVTAQIFLDTLRHGYIHMDRVNLVIFDECHHTTKKHPYNVIMREFYDPCPQADRPRIFGMTASPMHSKNGVQYSATQLEQNLCCEIHTATRLDELMIVLNPPREIAIEYNVPMAYKTTDLGLALQQKMGSIERFNFCFKRANQVLCELGPWCADQLWKYMLLELDRKLTVATQDLDPEIMLAEDKALKESAKLVEDSLDTHPKKTTAYFSPKVLRLIEVLKVFTAKVKDGTFCGIIFVETRHTARSLMLIINSLPELSVYECDLLVGHGTREEGDIKMGFTEQNRVIDKFRKGELNLLIATNVAEEGLDIQPCNVVIRFDFMSTPIAYIQSRGRARRQDSRFIIFIESGNRQQRDTIQKFKEMEIGMREFCQTLPKDRNTALKFMNEDYDLYSNNYYGSRPFDPEVDDDEDYMENAYVVKNTQAMVTKQSAVPLLYRYCGSLPSDSFTLLQPSFEINNSITSGGYTCTIYLPSNAAVREVTSKVARSKELAKKLAAVECCKQLHLRKALTDHLLPINYKREILGDMKPVVDEHGNIVGSRRRKAIYEKRTPRFWERRLNKWEAKFYDAEDDGLNIIEKRMEEITNNEIEAVRTATANTASMAKTEVKVKTNGTATTESVMVKEMDIVENSVEKGRIKKVEEEKDIILLDDMDGPFDLYLSCVEIKIDNNTFDGIQLRQLCLLTWKPFPPIPDIKLFKMETDFNVQIHSYSYSVPISKNDLLVLKEFNLLMASSITNKDFSCTLDAFPYFLAPLKVRESNNSSILDNSKFDISILMANIDWDGIRQANEKQLISLEGRKKDTLEDAILIDYADSGRKYFVQKIYHDLTPNSPIDDAIAIREAGYASVADYYKKKFDVDVIDSEQPIINVRKISKVMNYLSPRSAIESKTRKSTASFVIPEFCQQFYISASIFQTWMIVPSIMTRIDAVLLVQEAKRRYHLTIHDDQMLTAYTTPSASMEMNYERLETLGDSFLKFVATIRLYINFPLSNEGELHCLRIRVICNRALYRAAKQLKIFRYVSSHTFNRRYWRPHHFVASNDTEDTLSETKKHSLSDKTLADIVEASLGAAYLSGGLECGLQCAIEMKIPFDGLQTWADFWPAFVISREKGPSRAVEQASKSVDIPRIQELSGYKFETSLLIVEALTHASLPNSTAPCYQRLEFLGDAILDFLVINYLFNKYPEADPGRITDLKDACVNNHVLGIVAIENGLHAHIIHYSGILVSAIEDAVNEVKAIKKNGKDVGEYWLGLTIPKVLSDVVESMIGAVFVDSHFNLAPVQALFEKWLVPLLDKQVSPSLIQVHPVNRMITYFQRQGCDKFMIRNVTSSGTGGNSQKCVIFLHDKPFATGASDNVKPARRQAAERALERLKDDPYILERICDCGIIRQQKLDQKILEEENEENEENYF
ncbi:unnamed protein product [Cunninghamella echinulata]